jgi:cellulose biosynthesis protein BcsQ
VSRLLDKRLVFVTGKGGVGKSTVATALGMIAARSGRRTIVAELASQQRVTGNFDQEAEHFTCTSRSARLDTCSARAACSPPSRWPRPVCASC